MKKGKELNKNIGAKASTISFRGCSCHPSDSKSQSHRSQQNRLKQEERRHWTQCTECVAIWETGEWTEKLTFSTFIPLPKKSDLKKCKNYRTIAPVSHASKILFLIMLERIPVKTKTEIADEEAGFRQRRTKRPNHESQNTDTEGMRAPATTLYVLCKLQEGIRLDFP